MSLFHFILLLIFSDCFPLTTFMLWIYCVNAFFSLALITSVNFIFIFIAVALAVGKKISLQKRGNCYQFSCYAKAQYTMAATMRLHMPFNRYGNMCGSVATVTHSHI